MLLVLGINAFVDDTNMIHGAPGMASFSDIIKVLQQNLDLWQGLLWGSGGAFNAKKCSWTFIWSYNKYGHAHLLPLDDNSLFKIHTQNMYGNTHTLKINQPSEAICLLGVHIVADGSYGKELSVLQQKQD